MIFTLGESVLDIIFEDGRVVASTPGGAMLNTAVSLGRLGCKVSHISELSDDLCGNLILNFLRENGVNTDFLTVHPSGKTTLAIAFLNKQKDAEYNFYRSEPSYLSPTPTPSFTAGDLLMFGSFYSLNPQNRSKVLKIITAAKEIGALVLYDPNIRKAHCPLSAQEKEWVLENISLSDIVRGSDEDFKNVLGTDNFAAIYDMVQQRGCRHLFLTKGAGGSFYKNGDLELHVPAKALQPISTIGAGDTFNAGLLYGISSGSLLPIHAEKIMKTAVEMASEVCMSRENYIAKREIS
ncbi:MAG: carbohydrate kinase [Bacteroidales bacterium]|nr:carbohydrate kinase [Bacteroidales bacterium]